MNRERALGLALTAAGALGYVAGTQVVYPGRALAVTAVMVGVALLAVGNAGAPAEVEP